MFPPQWIRGDSSIPCPYTEHHAEYQPMQWTPDRQPLGDEMQPQDSLAPIPHSPIGMEASLTTTHFQAMAPQSETEVSLPPQVIVEEAQEYDGPGGSGSQTLKPSYMRRFKRTSKRIVKRPPTYKSRLSPNVLNNSLNFPMLIV